jgi:hypothetical protein
LPKVHRGPEGMPQVLLRRHVRGRTA